MPSLVVLSGSLEGQRIEILHEVTLGRDGADVEIDDDEVSRQHARVTVDGGGLRIEDLGSRNGTRVNGRRIEGVVSIANEALVKIGQTLMRAEVAVEETPSGDLKSQATREAAVSDDELAAPGKRSNLTQVGQIPARRHPRTPAVDHPAAVGVPPRDSAAGSTSRPVEPFGSHRAPVSSTPRGVATRLWVPMVMTYVAIVGTAGGLIAYFASR
jgi:predicted component of type VI protein secretion system